MRFIKSRSDFFDGSDMVFSDNSAKFGAAIFAEELANLEDEIDEVSFDYSIRFNKLVINDTRFSENSGSNGGALHFRNIAVVMRNVTFEKNRAKEVGGSFLLSRRATLLIIGGTFQNNTASSGGAVRIEENSILYCIDCNLTNNHASSDGGAVSIVSDFIRGQDVIFQCDLCLVINNRARRGGIGK